MSGALLCYLLYKLIVKDYPCHTDFAVQLEMDIILENDNDMR